MRILAFLHVIICRLYTSAARAPRAKRRLDAGESAVIQSNRKRSSSTPFITKADSWSRYFRVIAKVEVSNDGTNIRFILTDLENAKATALYQQGYSARGTAEVNIKEHKLYLKSDRTSCHRFEANQFRLFLHSAAYVLFHALKTNILKNTQWAKGNHRNHSFAVPENRRLFPGIENQNQSRIAIKLSLKTATNTQLSDSHNIEQNIVNESSQIASITTCPPLRSTDNRAHKRQNIALAIQNSSLPLTFRACSRLKLNRHKCTQ